jgi:hypothetical protein
MFSPKSTDAVHLLLAGYAVVKCTLISILRYQDSKAKPKQAGKPAGNALITLAPSKTRATWGTWIRLRRA